MFCCASRSQLVAPELQPCRSSLADVLPDCTHPAQPHIGVGLCARTRPSGDKLVWGCRWDCWRVVTGGRGLGAALYDRLRALFHSKLELY